MDDMMGRLTEVLSDEESMKQLSELAEMLKGGMAEDAQDCENSGSGDIFDGEMMMKLMGIAGAMGGSDINTELLIALRPHLSQYRQERLDRAVKMLRLVTVYEAAKEAKLL